MYTITARVTRGKRVGSTIGFPTANLSPEDAKAAPPEGVYVSITIIGADEYISITNVGARPTVDDDPVPTIETHIIGYSGDLYGEIITVKLVKRLRDTLKFNGLDALTDQLKRDVISAREYAQRGIND